LQALKDEVEKAKAEAEACLKAKSELEAILAAKEAALAEASAKVCALLEFDSSSTLTLTVRLSNSKRTMRTSRNIATRTTNFSEGDSRS